MASYASSGTLKDELIIVELCERFGWTYKEYLEQPLWFINLILDKISIESKRSQVNKSP